MHISTVVIGAGHAGLAMSRRLTERSIDHVVLERGEVANSWRTERRPTLRLLTPNWQTQLPGMAYGGDDPNGFMTMPEVADFVRCYADRIAAPVEAGTTVTRVGALDHGYEVATDRGRWTCATVVLASGASNMARVPALAAAIPPGVTTITSMDYREPQQLDARPVLVVGASASGAQIADEVRRSGREVILSVGEHVRMPRRYRGRDVFWWLDAAGVLDQRHDQLDDLVRARHLPSPQLVGGTDGRSIDLNALGDSGVQLVGRFAGVTERSFQFSGGLANICSLADLKMNRLLGLFDDWAAARRCDDIGAPERPDATRVPAAPALGVPVGEIGTVIWATGYRPDHSWLDLPVFDRSGRLRHDGGVVADAPGVYLLGANVLRRRRSSYISGADADTADLAACLHDHLDRRALGRSCNSDN